MYKRQLNDCSKFEVGDQLTANIFAAGDFVDVTGISKGHGFQGVVKRHGAAIKRMTHGGGPVHRHQGSLGAGTTLSLIHISSATPSASPTA